MTISSAENTRRFGLMGEMPEPVAKRLTSLGDLGDPVKHLDLGGLIHLICPVPSPMSDEGTPDFEGTQQLNFSPKSLHFFWKRSGKNIKYLEIFRTLGMHLPDLAWQGWQGT